MRVDTHPEQSTRACLPSMEFGLQNGVWSTENIVNSKTDDETEVIGRAYLAQESLIYF